MFKTLQWEDWMGIALGAWLLASPWVLGYSDNSVATMNALVMGSILVLEEMLDLGIHESFEEWVDIAAGTWLIASPFVLGFAPAVAASVNAAAVGLFAIFFAAIALSPVEQKISHWWDHFAGGL